MEHYLPPSIARQQQHDRVIEALALAYRRGLPIPAEIIKAKAMCTAVDDLSHGSPDLATPALPAKPTDLAGVIAKTAAARTQQEHTRNIAAELQPLAADRLISEIRAALGGWVQPLITAFDDRLSVFRRVEHTAPHIPADQLARLDPDSFSAWQEAQTTAFDLEALIEDRRILAHALGENFTSTVFGDLLALAAVVTPPNGNRTDDLTREARLRVPALQEISKGIPVPQMTNGPGTQPLQGVARWRALLTAEARGWVRLSLADLDQAPARLQLANAWADVVPHITADSQNQGGTLTHDLLNRAANAHRALAAV